MSTATTKSTSTAPGGLPGVFILTREWRDGRDGLELVYWAWSAEGPVRVRISGAESVCFVDGRISEQELRSKIAGSWRWRELELKSFNGAPVAGVYFRQQRDLFAFRDAARGHAIDVYESDIKPADRHLMERFVTAGCTLDGPSVQRDGFLDFHNPFMRPAEIVPALKLASVDIETSDIEGDLYSIAVSSDTDSRVFVVQGAQWSETPKVDGVADAHIEVLENEVAALNAFFSWLQRHDPDVLIGWNVIGFDLDFIDQRCRQHGIRFAAARARSRAAILRPQGQGDTYVARIPGRVVLDGIESLRAAFWNFEDFSLEAVANQLLGRGKLIAKDSDKVAEIRRLYSEEPAALAAYNMEDCRLVREIFDHTELIPFVVQKAVLTGLSLGRLGGSVAAFDFLYLPRLHRKGYVAPDNLRSTSTVASPGGYVMDSLPGLYDNVLLLDFKSLYPSIIRTFRIDPLGLAAPGDDPIPGFNEALFSREESILPELIEQLWQARDVAKREANAPMSQAIKIIMNSFYGVLGSSGCRFFDPRLASSITRRGHEIIQSSREYIQDEHGLTVVYGDTDSVFVLLGEAYSEADARSRGEALAAELNVWWTERIKSRYAIDSALEIEFETLFEKFVMPTIRGTDKGSKKRYAGVVRNAEGVAELVFKGLETVRTDWTPLARRFQRELYRRAFMQEPVEEYIRETVSALDLGQLDAELIYRKRLRRKLDDYTTNVPPHVQAARKLDRPGRWISYVITNAGPHPVDLEPQRPDYDHYRERQLKPVADGILYFLGTSFDEIASDQIRMF